ncbi:MAG: acyltransferase domain-containing protein, partial [Deltaproteobacteria bacterium]
GARISAVVRGVGGSSDGRSLGLTAPRKEGQVRALERAYRQAGVSPADVGLVEAHGTGTVVGDRTELATLTEVFERSGAAPGQTALGSVKSQIGHTKCAAGMAGLIKAALSLHHHVLPPTLHVERPNPGWDRAKSPFVLSGVARPWLPPPSGATRKAAVSAFGFGGTNFHAVLAEYPRAELPAAGGARFPKELFLLRGATATEARERAAALRARLEMPVPGTFADLAYTVGAEGRGEPQLAIVAQDPDDLRRKLARAEAGQSGDGVFAASGLAPGAVAFLFPGQGSQRPGMLGDLFVAFPQLQRLLELGRRWAPLLFPPPGLDDAEREAQAAALTETQVAQPALGVVELAALELLSSLGVRPDLVGGHSYGELVALCAAGALSQPALLELSLARARCILDSVGAEPGGMAAVSAPLERVRALCLGTELVVANENSPSQAVVAGSRAALELGLERFAREGIATQRLRVACAFHSPLLAGAEAAFARELARVELRAPALPVYSNVLAERYPASPDDARALLAKQLVSPVRFAAQVEAMYAAGARLFVEVGPGQVLTRLVGRTLGDRPHLALAIAREGQPGLSELLEALGQLAVHGVPLQLAPLFAGRQVRRLDLAAPMPKPPVALWLVDGQLARPAVGELPEGSLRPNEEPLTLLAPAAPGSEREGSVVQYLRGMRELAEAQREVMLRYLGKSEGADAVSPEVAGRQAAAAPSQGTLERLDARRPEALAARPVQGATPEAEALGAASVDVAQLLLRLVSERTGYPAEMLNLDADMEAELSIDSIKRIEILGALTQRLGLGKGGASTDVPMEKLASVKTLRGISDWIAQRTSGGTTNGAPKALGAGAPPAEAEPQKAVALHWAQGELVPCPLTSAPAAVGGAVSGRTWIA